MSTLVRSTAVCLLVASFGLYGPAEIKSAEPVAPLRVLFLGDQGHHRPAEMLALAREGLQPAGWQIEYTEDVNELNAARLAQFDCLLFFRDSGDLPPEAESALLEYIESGHGLVAVHCASHCFRNSARYTALIGARFHTHETGVFRARIIDAQHPAMANVKSFEAWDETYLHNETSNDRHVLMVREHAAGVEPYTWVRQQGQGRVYYTALGHDHNAWANKAFHRQLDQAARWAAGQVADQAPPLEYETVEVGLPNYLPDQKWGTQGEQITRLQKPLSPADSIRHMHVPAGFRVELFAAEPDVVKPIAMTFDERGRLWVIESLDYPNRLLDNPETNGRDRIKICEDTDGDGRADKFTVFAENLNIPTGLTLARGGVIVALAPHLLFLKDTNGDDVADTREILLTGFGRKDTHAVHSNLHYGLDNWIWGSVGYSGGDIQAGGEQHRFGQGIFRFKPDGSQFELLTPTSNNTWGLGFNDRGDVFASTANNEHSVQMAVPNRFFEGVRGWHGVGSSGIADHRLYHPITGDVRQMDWFGAFTAACGHELITSNAYPEWYRNRVALVCEPTGHLVHMNWLAPQGSGFVAHDGYNLMASTDAWTSPIAAQVGPDGQVWMLDWYNAVIQHNPTPAGFENGPGNAYITPLRDQSHGRVYRIVYDGDGDGTPRQPKNLAQAKPAELIAALGDDNLLVRLSAQRLLVDQGDLSVTEALLEAVNAENPLLAAHALRTLAGLEAFEPWNEALHNALMTGLMHDVVRVRRAAIDALPRTAEGADLLLETERLSDADAGVRLHALLALAEMPGAAGVASAVVGMLSEPENATDRWIPTAAIAAGTESEQDFVLELLLIDGEEPSLAVLQAARVAAEHVARLARHEQAAELVLALSEGNPAVAGQVLDGLAVGWPEDNPPEVTDEMVDQLGVLIERLPAASRLRMVSLAQRWQVGPRFAAITEKLQAALWIILENGEASDADRLDAARQLSATAVTPEQLQRLADAINPRCSPELAGGLVAALQASAAPEVGALLVERFGSFTPAARAAATTALLQRREWTVALLQAIQEGDIALNDLTLDQKQQLIRHPHAEIAQQAQQLMASDSGVPNPDRQKVLEAMLPLADERGDATRGREIYKQQCAKCHTHSGEGNKIGPDLTGMAVHPRQELLGHIMDPSKSVEGNYRQYVVVTEDGLILTGLLASETRTAIEVMDAEAKKHVILRENIAELALSTKSLMPEGFEKLPPQDLVDLLEMLTSRGRYLPLPLDKVATVVSTRGMFFESSGEMERLVLPDWSPRTVAGVPFQLIDPLDGRIPNVILLNGPQGKVAPTMPKAVSVPCNGPVRALHLLSGISGWGFPASPAGSVTMIVRLHYADGQTEDHELKNGVHFADYIRQVDVPGSQFAFAMRGQQMRYLSVKPARTASIASIEFIKGPDATAPVILAATVEGIE